MKPEPAKQKESRLASILRERKEGKFTEASFRQLLRIVKRRAARVEAAVTPFLDDLGLFEEMVYLWRLTSRGQGRQDFDAASDPPSESDRKAAMMHAACGIRRLSITWVSRKEAVGEMDELPPFPLAPNLVKLLLALCEGEQSNDAFKTLWLGPKELAKQMNYMTDESEERIADRIQNLIFRLREALPNRYHIQTDGQRYRLLLRQGAKVEVAELANQRQRSDDY